MSTRIKLQRIINKAHILILRYNYNTSWRASEYKKAIRQLIFTEMRDWEYVFDWSVDCVFVLSAARNPADRKRWFRVELRYRVDDDRESIIYRYIEHQDFSGPWFDNGVVYG